MTRTRWLRFAKLPKAPSSWIICHGLRRHVEIEDQPDDLMMAYQDQLIEPAPSLRPDEELDFDLGSAEQPTFDDAPEFE